LELQNFKTIIFDLGGVIIDLNVAATFEAFAHITQIPLEQMMDHAADDFFIQYEKGLISSADFRDEIRKLSKVVLSDVEIDTAWNAMLGAIPLQRIEMLKSLHQTHQVMILSNTNAIHEIAFHKILHGVSGKDHLSHFADQVYFSHDINMRKPDMEIYDFVIKENNLNAAQTLFLDDKLENLAGAESCGIQTMHITHPNLILTLK
jgi:HAD superfamily hydrolase (TIGR01509 family)